MFLAEGSSREGEKPFLGSNCTRLFLSWNGSCREMLPVKRGVLVSLVVPGRGWQGPRPRTNQVAPASTSCLHRAGMTTRSSQTPGQWATQWRRRRTRAGSARSSSADRPAPHGRGCSLWEGSPQPTLQSSLPSPLGRGIALRFQGQRKRLVKNGSQDCLQQRVTSPLTPTLPDTCSHSAPGGFVFKLPHHSRTVQRE